MIPAKNKSTIAKLAKREPIIIKSWYEANSNGGLIPMYSTKCHVCGGTIARTPRKNTLYHLDCGVTWNRVNNPNQLKAKISKMTVREKDKRLLAALEKLQEYEKRYGLLIGKDHIRVTDPLVRAIADKGRYDKLNMIAGEWLEGE